MQSWWVGLAAMLIVYGPLAGAASASDSRFEFRGKTVRARLTEGFHFNLQAPNELTVDGRKSKPSESEARALVFSLEREEFTSLAFVLYVCDDANTYCEPRRYTFGREGHAPAESSARLTHVDLVRTLEQAKRTRKPALLEFSARWCPGCLRLEAESLSNPRVRRAMRGYVPLALDYDRFETTAVREAYSVTAVPTLLAVDGDGREIARLIDYQPPAAVAGFLREAMSQPLSLEALGARADAGDRQAQRTLAHRLYAAGRYDDAIARFEQRASTSAELWDARVRAAALRAKADNALEKAWLNTLRDAIKAEPKLTIALKWRAELASRLEIASEERTKLGSEGTAIADNLIDKPARIVAALRGDNLGEFAGLETLYVADLRADLIEASGAGEATVAEARRLVAKIGEGLRIPASRRGPSLRLLIANARAKDWSAVESVARKMLAIFPDDPEIERRLSRALNQQGRFAEAIPIAERSRSKSYGLNEWWVTAELAKAYKGVGRTDEAIALATSYLARPEASEAGVKSAREDFTAIRDSPKAP